MKILKHVDGTVLPEIISVEAQTVPGGSSREIEVHICTPRQGVNSNTGLMLVSHNWGGTWEMCWDWCRVLSEKFNLITIDTDYYQTGPNWRDIGDYYDYGLYQAGDCLRALYAVRCYLEKSNIEFNKHRIYAAGASGGGNVSQMVNKLAPHTFGCIIDLCGMPGLTEDGAFGRLLVNGGFSRDPSAKNYLKKHMQEIRDFGNPEHLAFQYQCNPDNQVVIIHGVDDDYCYCPDKALIFANMLRAGFKAEGYFITPGMVDGIVIMDSGHALGDRAYIIAKYGQKFIGEKGEFVKLTMCDDFDRQSVIKYPVSGGCYKIDYSAGAPVITFEEQQSTQQ